jgi:hypothetical protein
MDAEFQRIQLDKPFIVQSATVVKNTCQKDYVYLEYDQLNRTQGIMESIEGN